MINHFNTIRFTAVFAVASLCGTQWSLAASIGISGQYRLGTNLFNNLDASSGQRPGTGDTTAFIEQKFLAEPIVRIDDHFYFHSELLVAAPRNANTPERYGWSLGSEQELEFQLSRAWMEWKSDWGTLRAGRRPKNWGLGILYSSGSDPRDDFGSTVDGISFEGLPGGVMSFSLGFEKLREGSVNFEGDDGEAYEMAINYQNIENRLKVGILWTITAAGGAGASPARGADAHDLSIFVEKGFGNFQVQGEFVNTKYSQGDSLIGTLLSFDHRPGAFRWGFDFAHASAGDSSTFVFHPNYRPFLILYNQSLGPVADSAELRGGFDGVGVGSSMAGGDGRGSVLLKGHLEYGFTNDVYVLGSDFGFAQLAKQGSNPGTALGYEIDIHLKQKWYENFHMNYGLGVFIPGDAFGPSKEVAWGTQIQGSLSF